MVTWPDPELLETPLDEDCRPELLDEVSVSLTLVVESSVVVVELFKALVTAAATLLSTEVPGSWRAAR
ncbi:MAG: hypothetical protein M3O93_05825 [Chloroflexota bacterium]|nr:hypothetical protein [Chloroflexota bacterium]